jgi:GT2 family glycosyltransferase
VAVAFTIVVVTWNSCPELQDLLDSTAEHLDALHEFVFVDNGSHDGTLELLERRRSSRDRIIAFTENRGFGAASNAGVLAARHPVVIFLNPDCVLIDGSLAELAQLASESEALCGPRMLNRDGSPQCSAFAPYASWESALLALLPAKAMGHKLLRRCDPWRLDERLDVGWISASCLAGPRELLLKLGPFDERLPHYGEDTDLCIRARRTGARVVFAPDTARIIHLGGTSAAKAFDDLGARRQMTASIWIARRRYGPARAAFAIGSLLLQHVTRLAAKRALGGDAEWHRASLRGWVEALVGRTHREIFLAGERPKETLPSGTSEQTP